MNESLQQQVSGIVEKVVKELIQTRLYKKRNTLIVANWKMNMSLNEAIHYFKNLDEGFSAEVVVCPPYPLLYPANIAIEQCKANVKLGAQNVHWQDNGAYTGEVSVQMLQDVGCRYVLLGHSERRAAGETDENVHQKIKQVLAKGMSPIICVGENEEAYTKGQTNQVVKKQVTSAVKNIADISNIIIAYEPIWAIGTGKSATPENAELIHQVIRQTLYELYGDISDTIPILYGGSVNLDNARSLAEKQNIDGVLVGGASLETKSFQSIIRSFNKEKGNT